MNIAHPCSKCCSIAKHRKQPKTNGLFSVIFGCFWYLAPPRPCILNDACSRPRHNKTIQQEFKPIWQKAASPCCHHPRRRMHSCVRWAVGRHIRQRRRANNAHYANCNASLSLIRLGGNMSS